MGKLLHLSYYSWKIRLQNPYSIIGMQYWIQKKKKIWDKAQSFTYVSKTWYLLHSDQVLHLCFFGNISLTNEL